MGKSILKQDFFNRHAVEVAQDLLGKILVFEDHQGIITETEAYRGEDDEASHAFRGRTKRSEIMFGPPGHAYIYLIYGMYFCLNVVTEPEGQASAVLIRGLLLPDNIHLNGPGKLCRHLGINMQHNGLNITTDHTFYFKEGLEQPHYKATPRIGIRKSIDKLWRFVKV